MIRMYKPVLYIFTFNSTLFVQHLLQFRSSVGKETQKQKKNAGPAVYGGGGGVFSKG